MKKTFYYLISIFTVSLLLFSCTPEEPSLDENLLLGKWKSTQKNEFYRYLDNHSGRTWDEDDDVHEDDEDVRRFNWSLNRSTMIHTYIAFITGEELVPKQYKITELTSSSLRYEDDFGKKFSYIKVDD